MRKRPKELLILAALFGLVSLSIPLQVMFSYGYTPLELGAVIAGLAPLNWLVIAVSLVHAWLVYQASPLVILSTATFVGTILWNNWVVAEVGLNYSAPAVALATIGAVAAHIPLFGREVRRVLIDPKLRWWRTAPRKRATLQAVVRPVLGGELRSMTFDISSGGAFISLDSAVWPTTTKTHQMLRNLKVGARCSVRLVIDQLNVIQCGAEIIRHSSARGDYPSGFAVRFVAMDDAQRRILTGYVGKMAVAPHPMATA